MTNTSKQANVLYRKFEADTKNREFSAIAGQLTLAEIIQKAFKTKASNGVTYEDRWDLRVIKASDHPDRLINNIYFWEEFFRGESCAFGDLCAFRPGEMHAMFDGKHEPAKNVSIQDMVVPDDKEILDGIAHWLAIDNHCYIVQDAHVRTQAFEHYLALFFAEVFKLNMLPNIILRAEFDIRRARGYLDDIKSIRVGGVVPTGKSRGDMRRPQFNGGRKLLEALLGPMVVEEAFDDAPQGADFNVDLYIGYSTTRYGIDRRNLRNLMIGLRNLDDGEVTAESSDGKISGKEVRLQKRMSFRRVNPNGKLLVLEDLQEKILKLHEELLISGKISD